MCLHTIPKSFVCLCVLCSAYVTQANTSAQYLCSSTHLSCHALELPSPKVDSTNRGDSIYPSKHQPVKIHSQAFTKDVWRALGQAIGVNLGVWSFDHYIMHEDFADISLYSIRHNLEEGFGWDNDKFVTNLFAHPYHGSLYYNAGRVNGLGILPSALLAYGGSMMWELFMEVEPPSINDLCATSLGGSALGEISYRIADLIRDDRTSGYERTVREIIGGIINPVLFLNRLIDGQAFRPALHSGREYPSAAVQWQISSGIRFLRDYEHSHMGTLGGTLEISIAYEDPYTEIESGPFDWFRIRTMLNLSDTQPMLGEVNITAPLWAKRIHKHTNSEIQAGIFQQFDYYNSDKTSQSRPEAPLPYRLSQVAAYGPGLLYRLQASPSLTLETECYVNGILLGASLSDYYHHENRDYNLGSGYSCHAHFEANYMHRWQISIDAELYHLFSWVGYDPDGNKPVNFYKVQGDKSDSRLLGVRYSLTYSPHRWFVSLSARHMSRGTHYRYLTDVKYATSDVQLSLGVMI